MGFIAGVIIFIIGVGVGSFFPQPEKFKAVWDWFDTKYEEFKNKE